MQAQLQRGVTGSSTRAHTFLQGRRVGQVVCPANGTRRGRSQHVVECKKVAVLGAAGGIGQPLSLLLKMNRMVTELNLYDIANVAGVQADLSHCNTPVKVSAFTGPDQLEGALSGADVVLIPAGVPRKPGMTRDDLFNINAGIVKTLVEAVAKHCPKAVLLIISNPVNSTVPIASEILKAAGSYDARKVLGVTTLDVVRANTFVAEAKGLDLKDVDVPVVGGHAGATILPLLSQTVPPVTFTDAERAALTERIQNAGTEVVEAKAGAGSATLSMAYAAARMTESTLLGLSGESDVYECAFVASEVVPGVPFLATKVLLGKDGVSKVMPLGTLNDFEKAAFDKMLPELKTQIEKGLKFVREPSASKSS